MSCAAFLIRYASLLAVVCLASACGRDSSNLEIVAIGQPGAPFETGARLPVSAQLLRGATAQGLVMLDEQGQVIPGIADRWIVADDGLSYIFRLRNGNWPNRTPVTAESARAALRQAIAVLRGTPFALDLAAIEDIRVMTGRVIEIRLVRAQPQFLTLLAQPELGLMHKARGGGPMSAAPSGKVVFLTPLDPQKLGMPPMAGWADRIRTLRFRAIPAARAVELFNTGKVNAVLGGSFDQYPLVDTVGFSRGAVRIDPVYGLFGLVVARTEGLLAEPANREALAMAIDRDRLASSVGVGGWAASTVIVPPGVEGAAAGPGERWGELALPARRRIAAARVARWQAGAGRPAVLRLALPAGPGSDRLAGWFSEDFGAIGVQVQRVKENEPADLRLIDAVARYPGAEWFINQLGCSNPRLVCSVAADQLMAKARRATDPAEHASLLAEAGAELLQANIYLPLGQPIRWSLIRGDLTGFSPNRLGYHPLMPMALRPK